MSKVFPKTLSFPAAGSRITLFADGTCDGDHRILSLALTSVDGAERPLSLGELSVISLWLVLRAMQDDAGTDRRVR